jgi:hypothetical protein
LRALLGHDPVQLVERVECAVQPPRQTAGHGAPEGGMRRCERMGHCRAVDAVQRVDRVVEAAEVHLQSTTPHAADRRAGLRPHGAVEVRPGGVQVAARVIDATRQGMSTALDVLVRRQAECFVSASACRCEVAPVVRDPTGQLEHRLVRPWPHQAIHIVGRPDMIGPSHPHACPGDARRWTIEQSDRLVQQPFGDRQVEPLDGDRGTLHQRLGSGFDGTALARVERRS